MTQQNQLVQRAGSDWLRLRRPADEQAREAAAPLLKRLTEHLSAAAGDQPVQVYDLGAGTGANLAWLAPRLPLPQEWTLIDRDADLLDQATAPPRATDAAPRQGQARAPEQTPGQGEVPGLDERQGLEQTQGPGQARGPEQRCPGVSTVRRRTADIAELASIMDGRPGPALVTCAAVLDVLTIEQVRSLCAVLAERRIPALFGLTVTGEVLMSPEGPLDVRIGEAFNAHQRRAGLAGPAAGRLAAEHLSRAGFEVDAASTPWRLGPGRQQLAERYLRDRVDAAVEQDPALAGPAGGWLRARLEQLRCGDLTVTVFHEDLVAVP